MGAKGKETFSSVLFQLFAYVPSAKKTVFGVVVLSLQSIIEIMPLFYTHCGSQLINQTLTLDEYLVLADTKILSVHLLFAPNTLRRSFDSRLKLLKNRSHSLKYTSLVEFVLSEGSIYGNVVG